jgi:hypothetical protein
MKENVHVETKPMDGFLMVEEKLIFEDDKVN